MTGTSSITSSQAVEMIQSMFNYFPFLLVVVVFVLVLLFFRR